MALLCLPRQTEADPQRRPLIFRYLFWLESGLVLMSPSGTYQTLPEALMKLLSLGLT